MVLAQIGTEVYQGQYERIGSIRDNGTGYLLVLRGWRQGPFCAKTNSRDMPFIDGKLYGYYADDNGSKRKQYAGKIWTHDDETGLVLYSGVLEVQPKEWEVLYVQDN